MQFLNLSKTGKYVNSNFIKTLSNLIQWNLSIADMLYSGHLSIADTFSETQRCPLLRGFTVFVLYLMRRSNCSVPIPLGHSRGHHFFESCPGLLITLFLACPALYKHSNLSFFECPAIFYQTHFLSDPGVAPGGMGAEQFDRRITLTSYFLFFDGAIWSKHSNENGCRRPSTGGFYRCKHRGWIA